MQKIFLQIIVISTLFGIYSPKTISAEIGLLDEADVVVSSRARTERQAALKTALSSVFVKNSGLPSVLEHPLVKAQINKPEVLLTQYGYREIDDELTLKANFDHKRIISTLRQADLPVWGRQRPLTLLWLSIEDEGERSILSDASELDTRAQIDLDSSNKGIPVILPVMDLDDVMKISVSDVRGMFTDVVADASTRYRADYFAVADMDKVGGFVRFQVSLFDKDSQGGIMQPLIHHQAEVLDYQEATDQILSTLAEYFVSQYAFADSGNSAETLLSLTGVQSMAQLVEIESYLNQLSAIKAVSLSQFKANTVTYKLELFGDADDLQKLLNINKRLTEIPQLDTNDELADMKFAPEQVTTLFYQWH
ncbi:DUF2066 domain-containing protein [Shewanella sp. TC10]|uniref:DUF2066 domain-containing protein n=1 Tax=Shewanella sp. TC10 TaxID=1419739 RepID=UPI00129EE3D8|nr:DUF2066 domain-containing protein [Shewanella sp. TC10]